MTDNSIIQRAESKDLTAAAPSAQSMMDSLAEMVKDPAVSADKLIALGKFQLELYDRGQKEQFTKDLNKALDDMPVIAKDGKIMGGGKDGKPKFVRATYSSFEQLMSVVRPILKVNHLRIRFDVIESGNALKVASILTHDNGFQETSGHMPIPITTPNRSVSMSEAAAMSATRGKRHVLKATLGIVEMDDDGQGKHYITIESEDWQEAFVTESRQHAMQGTEAYMVWCKAQPNAKRGYLVDTGDHAKNKAAAAQADAA